MSEDRYGELVRALGNVPVHMHGIVGEVLARLKGKEGLYWRGVYEKVHLKQDPFESCIDESRLLIVPKIRTIIHGIPKSQLHKYAFATMSEDSNSPFGHRGLGVRVGKSRATKKSQLQGYDLCEGVASGHLLEAVGGKEQIQRLHLVTPDQILQLVNRERDAERPALNGEKRILLTNGLPNFFLTECEDEPFALVGIRWHHDGYYWGVYSYPVRGEGLWSHSRLFLRAPRSSR